MKLICNIQRIVIFALIAGFFITGCGEDEEVAKSGITYGALTCKIINASTEIGIADATVVIDEEISDTTDANGRVTLDIPIGKHEIEAFAKGYIESSLSVTVRSDGINVKIALTPGIRVTGEVTSDVGNFVAGVRVSLGNHSRFTDGVGEYTLSPVLPGSYRLLAEKAGYKKVVREAVRVEQEDMSIDLVLTRQVAGRILFEKGLRNKASFGISVVNADGTGVVEELTTLTDKAPTWSPDGTKIAFQGKGQERGGGAWKIYIMNGDGTGVENISHNNENDIMPAWSPDGSRIAFVHWDILGEPGLYVMNIDGTNRQKLTTCAPEGGPTWSPDSSKIAFVKKTRIVQGEEEEEVIEKGLDIYVINADGADEKRLTTDRDDELSPAWSPDGSKLTYTIVAGTNMADVYVRAWYSGGADRVSSSPGYNGPSCWSPDGTKIAFASSRYGSHGIYMVDTDGGNETLVYNNPGEDEMVNQGCWRE